MSFWGLDVAILTGGSQNAQLHLWIKKPQQPHLQEDMQLCSSSAGNSSWFHHLDQELHWLLLHNDAQMI